MAKDFNDMFNCFGTTAECDGRTDRQTDGRTDTAVTQPRSP